MHSDLELGFRRTWPVCCLYSKGLVSVLEKIGYDASAGPLPHVLAREDLLQRAVVGIERHGEWYANVELEGFECPEGFELGIEYQKALSLAKWMVTGCAELSFSAPEGERPLDKQADRELLEEIGWARDGWFSWSFTLRGNRLDRAQELGLLTHHEIWLAENGG